MSQLIERQKKVPGDFPITERFVTALQLANEWHLGQYRKVADGQQPTTPYIAHLLGVASVALEFGATEDEAIAALLHDALEDGPENMGVGAEELEKVITKTFTSKVTEIVKAATDDMPKAGEQKRPWADRKSEYLQKLKEKKAEDASGLLVTASDKLYNARAILSDVMTLPADKRDDFFNRFSQRKEGTLQYYRLLVDAYRMAPGSQSKPRLTELVEELARTVAALEEACGVKEDDVREYAPLRGTLTK